MGTGDLRLEHVYFEDAEPIVIDCVEFNERLRTGMRPPTWRSWPWS